MDEQEFYRKHRWILRKLERLFGQNLTLAEAAQFTAAELLEVPRWGRRSDRLMRRFLSDMEACPPKASSSVSFTKWDLPRKPVAFNLTYLSKTENKSLMKLREHTQRTFDPLELVNFSSREALSVKAIGRRTVESIQELQERTRGELEKLAHQPINQIVNSGILVWRQDMLLVASDLDRILVDDLECYLKQLDDRDRALAQSRLGYHEDFRTYQELANKENLSRERVRQIVGLEHLPKIFRYDGYTLGRSISALSTVDLVEALPVFSDGFSSQRAFLTALETCGSLAQGSLLTKQTIPEGFSSSSWLREIVENTPSPIRVTDLRSMLAEDYNMTPLQTSKVLQMLVAKKKLEIVEDIVYPRNMERATSVAHVLAGEPSGLPWSDVVEIVNMKRISKGTIESGKRPGYFSDDIVYLCGKGCYRHIRFFEVPEDLALLLLSRVREELDRSATKALKLENIAPACLSGVDLDYYTLRQVVSQRGEEVGVYFEGKSSVDTVKLDRDKENITVSARIEQMLQGSERALSINEIAEGTRSKSLVAARAAVSGLVQSGRAIRVHRVFYWTPQRAFSGVDIHLLGKRLHEIVYTDERPIEADSVRIEMNKTFDLNYSKDFYVGLARHVAKDLGIYITRSLLSRSPIAFSSLIDVVEFCHQTSGELEVSTKNLRQHVRISDEIASRAIYNWGLNIGLSADED